MQAGKNIKSANISEEKTERNVYKCFGGNGIRGFVSNYNRKGHFALIGRQGTLCGNINVANGNFYATEHAVVVDHYNITDVLWCGWFLKALNLNQYATATAQPGLAVSNIVKVLIPLPPLAEQKRIVAKIEELLPYIDRYEKAWSKLEQLNKRFPEDMKKSLLQYAIEGKLVEQQPEDGTAEELFQKIKEEKQRLIREKKIKKEKPLPEITDNEKLFDIPGSWKWCRLDDIVVKTIKRGKSPTYTAKSNTLVFAQKCNTKLGYIDLSLAQCLNETKLSKYPEEEFMVNNDIVLNSTGNGTLGRVGIYRNSDNPKGYPVVPDSHVTIIRASNLICVEYVFYSLKYYQPYMEKLGSGSTNQTELSAGTVKALLFPLPPLAEQKRIVEKLEQLLPLCDRLNKKGIR